MIGVSESWDVHEPVVRRLVEKGRVLFWDPLGEGVTWPACLTQPRQSYSFPRRLVGKTEKSPLARQLPTVFWKPAVSGGWKGTFFAEFPPPPPRSAGILCSQSPAVCLDGAQIGPVRYRTLWSRPTHSWPTGGWAPRTESGLEGFGGLSFPWEHSGASHLPWRFLPTVLSCLQTHSGFSGVLPLLLLLPISQTPGQTLFHHRVTGPWESLKASIKKKKKKLVA